MRLVTYLGFITLSAACATQSAEPQNEQNASQGVQCRDYTASFIFEAMDTGDQSNALANRVFGSVSVDGRTAHIRKRLYRTTDLLVQTPTGPLDYVAGVFAGFFLDPTLDGMQVGLQYDLPFSKRCANAWHRSYFDPDTQQMADAATTATIEALLAKSYPNKTAGSLSYRSGNRGGYGNVIDGYLCFDTDFERGAVSSWTSYSSRLLDASIPTASEYWTIDASEGVASAGNLCTYDSMAPTDLSKVHCSVGTKPWDQRVLDTSRPYISAAINSLQKVSSIEDNTVMDGDILRDLSSRNLNAAGAGSWTNSVDLDANVALLENESKQLLASSSVNICSAAAAFAVDGLALSFITSRLGSALQTWAKDHGW